MPCYHFVLSLLKYCPECGLQRKMPVYCTHVRTLLIHYGKQWCTVFSTLLPQNSGLFRGWRRDGGEASVCEMLFRDNAPFNVPDLNGCVPPSPIQRVTLSHKASQRWQWYVCAQAELWLGCLMWRDKMAQGGQYSLVCVCVFTGVHAYVSKRV